MGRAWKIAGPAWGHALDELDARRLSVAGELMNIVKRSCAGRCISFVALLLCALSISHAQTREFALISINDVYRIEALDDGERGGLARVLTLRRELEKQYPDLLLLHAGDAFYPSLLSRRYHGAHMVDVLNGLDGKQDMRDGRMFMTFGNHEFDQGKCEDADDLRKRILESQFQWLSANIAFAPDKDGRPWLLAENLMPNTLVESGGVKVGIFGLTADIARPCYIESYLDIVSTAKAQSAELRERGAEVIIALTHQSVDDDAALLTQLGTSGPDLIIGGHEHGTQIRQVDGRWVLKADSDAASAIVARVKVDKRTGISVSHQLRQMSASIAPDAELLKLTDVWNKRFDQAFCAKQNMPAGCLDDKLSYTHTELQGEELFVRAHESALGNWIADQMREEFPDQESGLARVAVVISGILRLNQNIRAGADIKRRHIEELFPYANTLKLLKVDGATLRKLARHSASLKQQGGWLQISGLAYRMSESGARDISVLSADGPRELRDDAFYSLVTIDYLVDPTGDQLGYTMLKPEHVLASGGNLKQLVYARLKDAGEGGIAPRIEGRICDADTHICLARARRSTSAQDKPH